jgi:hypothetical protein
MTKDVVAAITNQSPADLTAIVRQILDEDATPIGDLTAIEIGRSAGTATAGIYHVTGRAETDAGEAGWSAVVKALGTPKIEAAGRQEYDAYREIEVYGSGVFADVHGGLRAAHCYAIQDRGDLLLLWMEDLSHAPQAPWQPKHFIATARNLGQFNAYWPEDALPEWEWMSRTGFRGSFTGAPAYQDLFASLGDYASDPLMEAFMSHTSVDEFLRLWRDLDELIGLVESTSRGVCHRDCHAKNLFPLNDANGECCTVAIDWVKVGIANFGMDVGHLMASPLVWLEQTPEESKALRDPVLDAYVSGLADSGWSGSADGVRLTFLTRLACEAIRATVLVAGSIDNPVFRAQLEQLLGVQATEMADRYAETARYYLECRDEAMAVAERMR